MVAMNAGMWPRAVDCSRTAINRLKWTAEGRRVDVGVVATDHTTLAQRAHPTEARRRGDAHLLGQRIVRDACILGEHAQQSAVDLVHFGVKILRWKGRGTRSR